MLGDPFDDGHDDGPAEQRAASRRRWTSTSPTRVERGATVVAGGARAAGFPTDLYWQATILDGVPADALVATRGDLRPGRAGRRDRLARPGDRAGQRLAVRAARRDLHRATWPGLRFADAVRTGWVNVNESSNYWESHLPFGGRAGTASGIGRVGGARPDGGVHRAADVVLA